MWHLYRFTPDDNAEAQRLFRQAATKSSGFAPAHSGLTHALYFAFMHGYCDDRAALLAEALAAGRKAIATDERDADAHFALGRILYLKHDLDASIAECQTAVSQNPNFAQAHLGLGTAHTWAGDWAEAIEDCDRAIRLSPHDPLLWIMLVAKAFALLGSGLIEDAETVARRAARLPTAEFTAHVALTAVLGHRGNESEAHAAMADLRRLRPDFSVDDIRHGLPFRNPADFDRVVAGLRKAGLDD